MKKHLRTSACKLKHWFKFVFQKNNNTIHTDKLISYVTRKELKFHNLLWETCEMISISSKTGKIYLDLMYRLSSFWLLSLFVNCFNVYQCKYVMLGFHLLFVTELSTLRRLLSSSCDEDISGNAALCLAHCFEVEGVATHMLGTDIILLLLRLAAGEAKKTAVQQNAAIAIGKLCRFEPRYPLTSHYRPQNIIYSLEANI